MSNPMKGKKEAELSSLSNQEISGVIKKSAPGSKQSTAAIKELTQRRGKLVRLFSYEPSQEDVIFLASTRAGDADRFLKENPERLLVERETREEELQRAEEVVPKVISQLTERQKQVLYLRSQYRTFDEISIALGVDKRLVIDDWKEIRKIAYKVLL